MQEIHIRRLDNYNFILASKLQEPKTVNIAGNEVVYSYKNIDKYYGNINGAINGLFRHLNINKKIEEYKNIKPTSDNELYMPFLEVGVDEILKIIEK